MLSINLFIPIDDNAKNFTKQIQNIYTIQYKEKRFIFYFTLFIYLIIMIAALFLLIIIYNINFQIIVNNLFN